MRRVAFVDAPGHEVLMATMLSGASIMDGAVLVIAANEKCPMPQTREHLAAVEITGLKNIVVAQNKVELVDEKRALENYQEISDFLKDTSAANAPIIPISGIHGANIDILIQAIEENIPTPVRDPNLPGRMLVARSFDVNLPGTLPAKMTGGVVGGAMTQGSLSVNEDIEVKPGIRRKDGSWQSMTSNISSLRSGFGKLRKASPGGLIGVGTLLDPALTKSDRLVGQVVGKPESLPPVWHSLTLEISLLERVVGAEQFSEVQEITTGEKLMLNVGTAKTVGTVTGKAGKNKLNLDLVIPVCAEIGDRVAISRNIERRYRLIGWGILEESN